MTSPAVPENSVLLRAADKPSVRRRRSRASCTSYEIDMPVSPGCEGLGGSHPSFLPVHVSAYPAPQAGTGKECKCQLPGVSCGPGTIRLSHDLCRRQAHRAGRRPRPTDHAPDPFSGHSAFATGNGSFCPLKRPCRCDRGTAPV